MDESDLNRLSLYLDGYLGQDDVQDLEQRLSHEAPLRVALDGLRHTDRWLRAPATWSDPEAKLTRRLSRPAKGEEDAELSALRATLESFEDGSIPAPSESLLQRVKARGTPSRSRSGRRRKSSVRIVRRSARLRLGSGSGSARIPRRRSSRISGTQRAVSGRRRPSSVGRAYAPAAAKNAPWSAWAGLLAAACLAFVVGGLLISRPSERRTAATPTEPVVAPPTPEVAPPSPAPRDPRLDEPTQPAPVEPELTEPVEPTQPAPVEPEVATRTERPVVDDGARIRVGARLSGALERRTEAGWEPLAADDELAPGMRLRAAEPSFASLDDGAYELCLDAETELLLRAAQGGPVFELERGRVLAEVVSLKQSQRFEVRAGANDFAVLGTVFEVARADDGATLGVLEGAVRASRGAESLVAPAGHGVRAGATLEAVDTPQAGAWASGLRAERRVAWSVDFEGDAAGFVGSTVATPARGGQALVLDPSNERAWARATSVEHPLVVERDLYVQLSVFSEADATVMLRFTNATQSDRHFMASYAVRAGQWRTLTVPVEALSTLYDPGANPLKTGDRLSRFEVLSGDPDAAHRVLVDDVSVYRKIYRR